ncbi:hypothetical protein PSAC2689_70205 [Paraburkholderia sacchari]
MHADHLGFTSASFKGINQVMFSYRTTTYAAAALQPVELEIEGNARGSVMFVSQGPRQRGIVSGVQPSPAMPRACCHVWKNRRHGRFTEIDGDTEFIPLPPDQGRLPLTATQSQFNARGENHVIKARASRQICRDHRRW